MNIRCAQDHGKRTRFPLSVPGAAPSLPRERKRPQIRQYQSTSSYLQVLITFVKNMCDHYSEGQCRCRWIDALSIAGKRIRLQVVVDQNSEAGTFSGKREWPAQRRGCSVRHCLRNACVLVIALVSGLDHSQLLVQRWPNQS